MNVEIFPKVYNVNKKQKIYIKTDAESVSIRIHGMEKYGIQHTENFRIDEDTRYPFIEMKKNADGLFECEYLFECEQRYTAFLLVDGERTKEYLYAVNDDLAELNFYKGDTHLHTNRSDGEGDPFYVGCEYRKVGFDFIAITDHHKMKPSIEGKEIFGKLTDKFTVFQGEEVHNKDMGYFHIVNFGGTVSVNDIIEENPDYVKAELEKILDRENFPENINALDAAYRIFIAEEIQKGGGLAIMAHPYWDEFYEYHMQTDTVVYFLKKGTFDALELLASCDYNWNGDNLQVALWGDLRANGVKIPIVGASDSHSTKRSDSLFNKHFTIVFAKDVNDIQKAIKDEKSVAVQFRDEKDFFVHGHFRYVTYTRFLLDEYYPEYTKLTQKHGEALSAENKEQISAVENDIKEFNKKFFVFK